MRPRSAKNRLYGEAYAPSTIDLARDARAAALLLVEFAAPHSPRALSTFADDTVSGGASGYVVRIGVPAGLLTRKGSPITMRSRLPRETSSLQAVWELQV